MIALLLNNTVRISMRKGNFFYQQQKEHFLSKQHLHIGEHDWSDEFSLSEQENILIEEFPVFVHSLTMPDSIRKELVLE